MCAQVGRLLPRLTREAYILEPSLSQLATVYLTLIINRPVLYYDIIYIRL